MHPCRRSHASFFRRFATIPQVAEEWSNSAIFRRDNVMHWPEFRRSNRLRWTVLVTCIFAAFTVALLGFVYLKTKRDLTLRFDRAIALEMENLVALPSGQRLDAINEGLQYDPGRHRMVGLFGAPGDRIAGDMERQPTDLQIDGTAQNAVADRIGRLGREQQAVRLIARTLPDGNVLLVGRDADEIEEVARVVGGALGL
jgi:hypothetical protein